MGLLKTKQKSALTIQLMKDVSNECNIGIQEIASESYQSTGGSLPTENSKDDISQLGKLRKNIN